MTAKTSVAIFNGFDRSGTSAITRTLALHPRIEVFMQPFNSGPLRQLMYKELNDSLVSNADVDFLEGLMSEKVDESYIKSKWFFEKSTSRVFVPGSLHIVKTTINHFAVPWLTRKFPQLPVWGIWRSPRAILKSIFRNGFETWFHGAHRQVCDAIAQSNALREAFGTFMNHDLSVREQVCLNFAVRTLHFFNHIATENVLYYEQFAADRQRELGKVVERWGLDDFDFPDTLGEDLNIVGARHYSECGCDEKSLIPRIADEILLRLKQRLPDKLQDAAVF